MLPNATNLFGRRLVHQAHPQICCSPSVQLGSIQHNDQVVEVYSPADGSSPFASRTTTWCVWNSVKQTGSSSAVGTSFTVRRQVYIQLLTVDVLCSIMRQWRKLNNQSRFWWKSFEQWTLHLRGLIMKLVKNKQNKMQWTPLGPSYPKCASRTLWILQRVLEAIPPTSEGLRLGWKTAEPVRNKIYTVFVGFSLGYAQPSTDGLHFFLGLSNTNLNQKTESVVITSDQHVKIATNPCEPIWNLEWDHYVLNFTT